MLRWLAGLLLAANLLFLGWSLGWMDGLLGSAASADREPERLAKQVNPERVVLWPAGPSAGASATGAPVQTPASGGLSVVAGGVAGGSAGAASVAASVGTAGAGAGAAPGASTAAATPVTGPAAASAVTARAAAHSGSGAMPPGAAPTPSNPVTAARPTAPASGALAAAAPSPAKPANPVAAAPATPVPAASVAATPIASPVQTACLEAGPFSPAELAAATTALRATAPQGGWVQRPGGTAANGDWMIYMGPYPDREWMERKKRELARIRGGVPQEEITAPPELARGISLGRYSSKAAADTALAQYALRGIRTARVVDAGPGGTPLNFLRFAQATPAVAASLADLKLPPRGARFTACPR